MQQQVGMDERDSRGRGVPSRLIRGRERVSVPVVAGIEKWEE